MKFSETAAGENLEGGCWYFPFVAVLFLLLGAAPALAASQVLKEGDFSGGEREISRNEIILLDDPGAGRGAVFRIIGDGDPLKQGVQFGAEAFRHPRFSFNQIEVERDGTLFLKRRQSKVMRKEPSDLPFDYAELELAAHPTAGTVASGTIRIHPGRQLTIHHIWDHQHFLIGGGSRLILETGSTLRLLAAQKRRNLTLRITKDGELRGSGTLLAESPSLSLDFRGETSIVIDPFGVIAPGTEETIGTLHIGREYGKTDSTEVKCEPQSRIRFRLNGPQAGAGSDQIVLRGNLILDETELELQAGQQLQKNDSVFLICVEEGRIDGQFHRFPEGSEVPIAGPNGTMQRAKISYVGNAKNNSLSGGNDVVLYEFQ